MKIANFKSKNNFMFLTPTKQLNLLNKQPAKVIETAFDLLCELLNDFDVSQIKQALNIHQGTIKRWLANKEVPDNYFNDLNDLLKNKYPSKNNYRKGDWDLMFNGIKFEIKTASIDVNNKFQNEGIKQDGDYGTVASLICFNFLLVLRRNFGYF